MLAIRQLSIHKIKQLIMQITLLLFATKAAVTFQIRDWKMKHMQIIGSQGLIKKYTRTRQNHLLQVSISRTICFQSYQRRKRMGINDIARIVRFQGIKLSLEMGIHHCLIIIIITVIFHRLICHNNDYYAIFETLISKQINN